MNRLQFRILYREFLFRMIDLELLASDAQGGAGKLFGQFATILILIGVALALIGAVLASLPVPPEVQLAIRWSAEHFLIETTMLVVGLFAVLSWDSTFPNRRDVFVLAPLPVRTRTMFLSKVAAVGTGLAVSVLALQFGAGLLMPVALTKATPAQIAPALEYDSAIPPVHAREFETVLRRDLGGTVIGNGAAIGVIKNGERRVVTYGNAKRDAAFPLGSISKTFTGLMLAEMVTEGKVRLDDPLRSILPAGAVGKPVGNEISLLDLATHHSGLPNMPYYLVRGFKAEPDSKYDADLLYALMSERGVGRAARERFAYSNVGISLLGLGLANRAGMSYGELFQKLVAGPLGLLNTRVDPTVDPHVSQWERNALAPAGGVSSTVDDMLTYLAANLHPEKLRNVGSLATALTASHELRAEAAGGAKIALAWMYSPETGTWWHSSTSSGFTSYAFFDPGHDAAAIILSSGAPTAFGFTDTLGEHVRARLAGEPALSVNSVRIPEAGGGVLDLVRMFFAYWFTMLAAGAFIFCCVLGLQGLSAQLLPRRLFLRVSPVLQLGAFCVLVLVYFLEPKIMTPGALAGRPNYWYIEWSPTYWFLGLLQAASGSPALPALARRAWIGLTIALVATAVSYALSYLRTMKKIVEEPDIAPSRGGWKWLPGFGGQFETAIGQFSVRTLLRSRQQRLMVSFYLGLGLAATILLIRALISGFAENPVRVGLLGSSVLVMGLWVAGTRVAFSLPVDLGANWIFRMTRAPDGRRCRAAVRRAFYAVSVIPMCVGSGLLLVRLWPWEAAVQHVMVLFLVGTILVEVCLVRASKLPFTCSYLPGKTNFHMTFLICSLLVVGLLVQAAQFEAGALEDAPAYSAMIAVLIFVWVVLRWRSSRQGELEFEEVADPAVFALDLHRDGVTSFGAGRE